MSTSESAKALTAALLVKMPKTHCFLVRFTDVLNVLDVAGIGAPIGG